MKRETQTKLGLFLDNANAIKKGISMTSGMDRRTAALIYAVNGKKMDRERIAESYAMLKGGTGILSSFRESTPLCNAALLSLEKKPQEALDRALSVYEMMKEVKFRSSPFLAAAALRIAAGTQPVDYRSTVARMRSFYDAMKAKNWLHTGADDYILAAMFAMSGMNEKAATESIHKLFERFKPEFSGKGSVLALAQVLTLGGQTDQAAIDRVLHLRDVLKKRKMSLTRPFIVPILGTLSQLNVDVDAIVQEARDVEIALKAQTGPDIVSLSKIEVHMVATAMAASAFSKTIGNDELVTATALTNTINTILATQMAFICIVVATTGAVTASLASS